jgi:hypothetical protein
VDGIDSSAFQRAAAYGRVAADGTLSRSKNVASIVHTASSGIYCINLAGSIDPNRTGALVSMDFFGDGSSSGPPAASDTQSFAEFVSSHANCTASQLEVRTFDQNFSSGALVGNSNTDNAFFFFVP